MKTEYRDIPNYEGLYQISKEGRVLNWRGHLLTRHRVMDLYKEKKKRKIMVDKLVLSAFVENHLFDNRYRVIHLDNNESNNNLENLKWECLTKKVEVYDKDSRTSKKFESLIEASKAINQNPAYISHRIRLNVFENDRYKWRLL